MGEGRGLNGLGPVSEREMEELRRRVRELEEAAREKEAVAARLKSLLRAAPLAMGMVSPDRVLLEVNDFLCRMLGYSREELVGKSALALYPTREDYEYVGREKYAQIERQGVGSVETRWRRKDGTVLDVLLSSARVDPCDPSAGTAFTALDITDIVAARRIQERREKLSAVFMRLGADVLGNIESLLKGAEEILECSLASYCLRVGERLSVLTTAPGEEGFTVALNKEDYLSHALISEGRRSPLVLPDIGLHPGAGRDPLVCGFSLASCVLFPVTVEGKTVGCLGCFDSRPREWTEEEVDLVGMLAQAVSVEQERLDREEELKDFVDVASHELRHPITVIKGYAQTLRGLWDRLTPGKREELLQAVEHGADRLERLVKELLDVSRIERGYFPVRREEVEVGSLLSDAAEELSNRGYSHLVSIVMRGEVEKVAADRDRLSLLLSILLDNAAKYSPPGSEIELEVAEDDGGVRFSVMDRGMGVPEEERERIFERFYQVEDALHHSTPGMGIGLYIAREIAEAHGGRIWCEAREGGGAVFSFVIPRGR